MQITPHLTTEALIQELGRRLARVRLERDLTQAQLAEEAGVSKRTVERLESGEVATQLSSFLRVCRVLGMLESFVAVLPVSTPSPMAQLKQKGRQRQRAAGRKVSIAPLQKWTWGDSK